MKNHLQGIDTVIVRVKDIDLSKKWYKEKLGLSPLYEDPIHRLAVMDTGGPTSLTLWETGEKIVTGKNGSAFPIFRTMDAKEAHHALSEADVQTDPVVTDHAVTYFQFYDPDGNLLEACQVHG